MMRRSEILFAISILSLAVLVGGCHKVENPHPETVDRHNLLIGNYWIRNTEADFDIDTDFGHPIHSNLGSQSFTSMTLRVLAVDHHLPTEVIGAFEDETGAKIDVSVYDGRIATLEARMAGTDTWDLLVVPGVVLQRLIEDDRILPLEHTLVPNLLRIDSYFRTNLFDPSQQYSVPYSWSTAGIAYNFSRLDFTPNSWAKLFDLDPQHISTLRGRVSLLPDAAFAIAPALIHLGYSPNSTNATELSEAAEFLHERMNALDLKLMAVPPGTALLNEDILIAECFGGDIVDVTSQNASILFAVPEDGTWERIEFLAIRNGTESGKIPLAHVLINYLLDAKVAGEIATVSHQASTLSQARTFVDSAIKHGPSYSKAPRAYPQRFDRDSNRLRQKIWENLTNAIPGPDL